MDSRNNAGFDPVEYMNRMNATAKALEKQNAEQALEAARKEMKRGDGDEGASTSLTIVPKEKLSTWPWLKWLEAFAIRIGVLLLGYFAILALQQYEIWEPCEWKISYHRECKVDTYIYEVLSYTTFTEDFYCVVPGLTFHQVESGWNLDRKCN